MYHIHMTEKRSSFLNHVYLTSHCTPYQTMANPTFIITTLLADRLNEVSNFRDGHTQDFAQHQHTHYLNLFTHQPRTTWPIILRKVNIWLSWETLQVSACGSADLPIVDKTQTTHGNVDEKKKKKRGCRVDGLGKQETKGK